MRHDTAPVGGHFHSGNSCATLHLRSAFLPSIMSCEKSHHALQDRHFRVSTHSTRGIARKLEASEWSCMDATRQETSGGRFRLQVEQDVSNRVAYLARG